jgi:hypothetical protein
MTDARGNDTAAPDFADRVTALYARPLDQFISARNSASAEARRAGDKDLAAELRALPKPSSAAWLVNVLVQRRRAEVEQVIELGASLKEAQAGMDRAQLQALGQQRQRLLAAVARESLTAASEAGHDVGAAALPAVEQTLRAALADPAAVAAVLSGRLIRTLEASGWDAVDLAGAVAGPFHRPGTAEDSEPPADGTDGARTDARSAAGAARRRKQAEAVLVAARASREAAESAAAAAQQDAERTRVRRRQVTSSIEDLEAELATLRRELAVLDTSQERLDRLVAEMTDELVEAKEDEDAALAEVEGLGN